MAIVAAFAIPAEEFALGRALQVDPEMTIELEQIVPSGQEMPPFFWAYNEDFEAFEAAAEEQVAIERLTILERQGHVGLFHAEWTENVSEFLRVVVETEATIVQGRGTADEWSFKLRFPDRESLREFRSACDDRGVEASLQRLQQLTALDGATLGEDGPTDFGLTEKQRDTLLLAFREGYFDDPREVTLDELAETFEVSPRAVSQRLRRAIYNLIENALDSNC